MSYLSEFIDYLGRPAIALEKEDLDDLYEDEVDVLASSPVSPVQKHNTNTLRVDNVKPSQSGLQDNESHLIKKPDVSVTKEGSSLLGVNNLDADDVFSAEPVDTNTKVELNEVHNHNSTLPASALPEEKNIDVSIPVQQDKIGHISVGNSENIQHIDENVHIDNHHEAVYQVQKSVTNSSSEHTYQAGPENDKAINPVAVPVKFEGDRQLYESGNFNNTTETYSESIQNLNNNYEIKNQAEIPQVRIGQINVVVHDDSVTKKQSRKSQKTSLTRNEFGLRGL